jgi:hypothetical protein
MFPNRLIGNPFSIGKKLYSKTEYIQHKTQNTYPTRMQKGWPRHWLYSSTLSHSSDQPRWYYRDAVSLLHPSPIWLLQYNLGPVQQAPFGLKKVITLGPNQPVHFKKNQWVHFFKKSANTNLLKSESLLNFKQIFN